MSTKKPKTTAKAKATAKSAKLAKPTKAAKPTKPAKAAKPVKASKPAKAAKPAKADQKKASAAKVSAKDKVAKKKSTPKKTAAVIKAEQEAIKNQNFAFSFAEEMKKAQRTAIVEKDSRTSEVKLSRRPDTRVKGKNTQKFPASDLAQFKKSLLLLRQTALGQSASLRDIALEQTEERGAEDDDGSDAFLRLQNLSQVDSQNRVVQKIDEALARIADGTYGVCENCGKLIRKPRLLNLPFVHTCMECQTLLEQG